MKRTVFTLIVSMQTLLMAVTFVSAEDHADRFYGYYAIHTVMDDKVEGMLSINGYTGDVWYHSWHGSIVQMDDSGDDHS